MGGNALTNVTRLDLMTYQTEFRKVHAVLQRFGYVVATPPSFTEKSEFGDIDVLVGDGRPSAEPLTWGIGTEAPVIIQQLRQVFELTSDQFVQNANSIAIAWPIGDGSLRVQVDLILVRKHCLSLATLYYGWGGFGVMLSQLARGIGLSLRDDGLTYSLRVAADGSIDTRKEAIVCNRIGISHNYLDIALVLGLDPICNTFPNASAMFSYLQASPYFGIACALSENGRDRKRQNVRQLFQDFRLFQLKYIDEHPESTAARSSDHGIRKVIRLFPSVGKTIDRCRQAEVIRRKATASLAGGFLMHATGLSGFNLGQLQRKLFENPELLTQYPVKTWSTEELLVHWAESTPEYYRALDVRRAATTLGLLA